MFAFNFRGKILLFYIVIRVIVRVFIADAPSKLFVASVMGVLKMGRNCCFDAFYRLHSCGNGIYGRVAFGCAGHISGSL